MSVVWPEGSAFGAELVGVSDNMAALSEFYQCVAAQPLEAQLGNLDFLLADTARGSGRFQAAAPYLALAEVWAAILERAHTPDSFRQKFMDVNITRANRIADTLRPYLPTMIAQVAEGSAPIGVTRLIADDYHPTFKLTSLHVATRRMLDALDSAAFAWFGMDGGEFEHFRDNGSVRLATREAYIAQRQRLATTEHPGLTAGRMARLAAVMPYEPGCYQALPPLVLDELRAAVIGSGNQIDKNMSHWL